jgi:activator of 2-hydroxyglutaryl-CoA dehydratase
MARVLERPIDQFGGFALSAEWAVRINTLCAVFAESEVVSALARGQNAASIALGLHEAAAERVVSLARRAGCQPPVVFCGGGALNPCLVALVGKAIGVELLVPRHPQGVGALGACLHALTAASA